MEERACDGQGEESYSTGKQKNKVMGGGEKKLNQERTRDWMKIKKTANFKEIVNWDRASPDTL